MIPVMIDENRYGNNFDLEAYLSKHPYKNPYQNMHIPSIREETEKGVQVFDIYSRLLVDRILCVEGVVCDEMASAVNAMLLYLDTVDNTQDIKLYINSPGGSVTAGLAMYDVMNLIGADVQTYCTGICASMGAYLLSAGTPGKRFCLPSSTVMIHMVSSGTQGTVKDQRIALDEGERLNDVIHENMAKHCGISKKEMLAATERDNYLNAKNAKAFGLVDDVVSSTWSSKRR
jgi:ATP-dependent Clp protease protease subunit